MAYKCGRDMGLTSSQVKYIFSIVKSGKRYNSFVLCDKCRAGFKVIDGKEELCEKCKGYGFIREI